MLLQMQNEDTSECVLPPQHRQICSSLQRAYLILQSIEAFKDELKHGVEVVWAWWGYKNIGIAGKNVSGSLAKTQVHILNES